MSNATPAQNAIVASVAVVASMLLVMLGKAVAAGAAFEPDWCAIALPATLCAAAGYVGMARKLELA